MTTETQNSAQFVQATLGAGPLATVCPPASYAAGTVLRLRDVAAVYVRGVTAGGVAEWQPVGGAGASAWGNFVASSDPDIAAPYTTIQSAINAALAAGAGNTVLVIPGAYAEALSIVGNVSVIGLGPSGDVNYISSPSNGVRITGNVTINLPDGGDAVLSNLRITGSVTVAGTTSYSVGLDGVAITPPVGVMGLIYTSTYAGGGVFVRLMRSVIQTSGAGAYCVYGTQEQDFRAYQSSLLSEAGTESVYVFNSICAFFNCDVRYGVRDVDNGFFTFGDTSVSGGTLPAVRVDGNSGAASIVSDSASSFQSSNAAGVFVVNVAALLVGGATLAGSVGLGTASGSWTPVVTAAASAPAPLKPYQVLSGASPYTLDAGAGHYVVTTGGVAAAVNLPTLLRAPATTTLKVTNGSAVGDVTVTSPDGQISGAANEVILPFGSVEFTRVATVVGTSYWLVTGRA